MAIAVSPTPLEHPGKAAAQRRRSVATLTAPRRVVLPEGTDLVAAMVRALESRGATCGQVQLLDGSLSQLDYCFPATCHDGTGVVTYSAPYEAATPVRLLSGSATVGFRSGERFAHCHATWLDADGQLRGGHLLPGATVGRGSVEAVIHPFDRVELVSDTDPETQLPVFTPYERDARPLDGGGGVRAVMSRLAPGVQLDQAIGEIMREHGFERASIAGSLGSLVGAVLRRSAGALVLDSPATEVILAGDTDLGHPEPLMSRIEGEAVDRFGEVHSGSFTNGGNIVAVTAELLVEEISR